MKGKGRGSGAEKREWFMSDNYYGVLETCSLQ